MPHNSEVIPTETLQPTRWQQIRKRFQPSNLEKLETELEKDCIKQKPNKIKSLVRAEYLKNGTLPTKIFKKNPTKIFNALKAIIQETSFNPAIIYHPSYEARNNTKKHSNEVHCVIFFHPNLNYFIFNLTLYDTYHTADNKTIFFNTERSHTQEIKAAGSGPLTQEQKAPVVNMLINTYLRTDSRSLCNAALINNARYALENHPFNLANDYFIQSDDSSYSTLEKAELIDKALQCCLYLPSSEDGMDFNTNFKKMIAETYFSATGAYKNKQETLSDITLLSLKESHKDPKQTYHELQREKKREDELKLESAVPSTLSSPIPDTVPLLAPIVELSHTDTVANKKRKRCPCIRLSK